LKNKLVLFFLWHGPNTKDLSEKGAIWASRYYQSAFKQVHLVDLIGYTNSPIEKDGIFIHTLGTGKTILDLIFAPWRLYKFCKKNSPDAILTYEQVFLWWIALPVKLFLKMKIHLTPVTLPESMYKATNSSLTGNIPIWLERKFVHLSYRIADVILTAKGLGSYVEYISANPLMAKKTIVVDALPESVPSPVFIESCNQSFEVKTGHGNFHSAPLRLLYVGRISKEKLINDLVRVMKIIISKNFSITLTVIGDGPDREDFFDLARQEKVDRYIKWEGYVTNGELAKYMHQADVFVSPLTGGSFREAAYFGFPIVAYKMDWIEKLLAPEEEYMAIRANDPEAFAEGVIKLIQEPELQKKLSQNIRRVARNLWSPAAVESSLKVIFLPN
jgi:glycosyltransferase involved in cell wall biosynthesis